ncbi:N-acetylmuramoyl-L-alanine amidase [Deinococcus sp.]|uniref:N-acetylmuramoyl-L-alanine amidase n=1 Tax=Deinococcus sp. TaxID=47478 RepID=UPI003B5BA574
MKRLIWVLLMCAALGFSAQATPRVGSHDGYTRLVFDLPAVTSATGKLSGQTYTVQLGKPLPSEAGNLSAAGLSKYAVQGNRLTLTLSGALPGGSQPKTQVLPAESGKPARLVVDVPIGPASTQTASAQKASAVKPAAKPSSAQANTAKANPPAPKPTIRPVSVRAPLTVVIDPGHGGVYPGMSSRWITEKEVTLDVALRVRKKLQARGIQVIMTRESDIQLGSNLTADLDARSRLANNGKVGAFVSIHVNAGNPSAQGIETYYFGAPMAGSSRNTAVFENGGGSLGQELTRKASNTAQNLLGDLVAQAKLTFSRDLAAQVQRSLLSATGAVNRGVRSDAFYVIKNPTTPAILTEIGFGSSPNEGPKLALAAYRDRIAGAIADAIAAYLHSP